MLYLDTISDYCAVKPNAAADVWQQHFLCDAHATDFVVALFTFVLAVTTIFLWAATRKQAALTREALIAENRAFVFADGFTQYWEKDEATEKYNWRFRPNLQNSGNTNTKNMTMFTECMLCNQPLPTGFDFSNATNNQIGKGFIPPKGKAQGSLAPRNTAITPQDILDVKQGRKYLYLWGWVKYHDVFVGTPVHVTSFCWMVTPSGDPHEFTPEKSTVQFPYVLNSEGNLAEDK